MNKEICPVCKMTLEEGKKYPEGFGKKFCSENCKEEYGKKFKNSRPAHSCCG